MYFSYKHFSFEKQRNPSRSSSAICRCSWGLGSSPTSVFLRRDIAEKKRCRRRRSRRLKAWMARTCRCHDTKCLNLIKFRGRRKPAWFGAVPCEVLSSRWYRPCDRSPTRREHSELTSRPRPNRYAGRQSKQLKFHQSKTPETPCLQGFPGFPKSQVTAGFE